MDAFSKIQLSAKVKIILVATVITKILLMLIFSSGYKDLLFIPFIDLFLEQGGNPWQNVFINSLGLEFPYPPAMLYLLSVFLWPLKTLGVTSPIAVDFMFGLPSLISDLFLFYALTRFFPWHKKELYIFYFVSPIILFSIYMHGQLDLIPTALIFAMLLLLNKKKFLYAAFILGIAMSTKFHTVAILPLIVIYLFNKYKYREVLYFLLIPTATYFIFIIPYVGSIGYQSIVMNNEKQLLLFNTYFSMGSLRVYLPILAAIIVYLRFYTFHKINKDLLFSVCGTLFSIFLLLILPSPGWFVWIVPFFAVFYIRYFRGYKHYFYSFALTMSYLIYFLFFHQYDYAPLTFLGHDVALTYDGSNIVYANIAFTVLEAVLLMSIIYFYQCGIKSNQIYLLEESLVLGIGGDSGSGKTTLLTSLNKLFGKELLKLEGDGYHRWERGSENWKEVTHLNPKANALDLQAEQIDLLKKRSSIKRSEYDHETGTFTLEKSVQSKNFIVIAGLHPFYLPKMRKVIDLKIYLDLDEELRVFWKVKRDVSHRGKDLQQVLDSIHQREADAEKYIRPQKKFADLIIKYFPQQKLDNISDQIPALGLTILLDASIPLGRLLQALDNVSAPFSWDYSEDLQFQELTINDESFHLDFDRLTEDNIVNASELAEDLHWDTGYAGLLQFIILFIVSEKIKERSLNYG